METPTLSEEAIRPLATARSFQRGQKLLDEDALLDPICQGMTLRAQCQGSDFEPYDVSATLTPGGVRDASCSCPYEGEGICKHSIALLLAFAHLPETFRVIPPLEELLKNRSRDELVALVKTLIESEPGLIDLVASSVAAKTGQAPNVQAFRRQVKNLFKQAEREAYGYDFNPHRLAKDLEKLFGGVKQREAGGDREGAGTLFAAFLEEMIEAYPTASEWDEDGDFCVVADDCAAGIGRCLGALGTALDQETRREWFDVLLQAKLVDITQGGIDFAPEAFDAILKYARDEEWAEIEARLRDEVKKAQDWRRESLVELLARGQESKGRGADKAKLIHELGTPQQRAFLMVEEGRIEEAVAIAREHFPHLPGLMVQFADLLVSHGASAAAIALMREQMQAGSSSRHNASLYVISANAGASYERLSYVQWLAKFYREQGDAAQALEWQRKAFLFRPEPAAYAVLREVATKAGAWEQERAALLQTLEKEKQFSVLASLALHEGDVNRVLELLPRLNPWERTAYREPLAKVAAKDHPKIAAATYMELADDHIEHRNREHYQTAARHLREAKTLHERLGQQIEWKAYMIKLRDKHKTLRALQDELNKAGL